MIDAGGWFDWMIVDPGPPGRVNGGKNGLRGVVIHSAEGYWPNLRQVLWGDRGSSWHFSNLKDGRCFQHYSIFAQTWTSGAGYPNNNFPAWENEGVAGEPFTEKQNDNNVRIISEIRALGKWAETRRPLNSADKLAQLWEHNEMTRFGAEPTACPSGRVPWSLYLQRLGGDMAITLAACIDSPSGYRVYALGSGEPKWITSAAVVNEIQQEWPQQIRAIPWQTLQALGAK